MSISIKGGASANILEVNVSGSTLTVQPIDIDTIGYATTLSMDPRANGQTIRSIQSSPDYRTTIGIDTIIWDDKFAHGAVDTSRYMIRTADSFVDISGGRLVLNSTSSVVTNASMRLQTHRMFTIGCAPSLRIDVNAATDITMTTEHGFEIGLGFPSTASTTPADGIFFRCSGNTMHAVLNYNSTETAEVLDFIITPGTIHKYRIILNEDQAEFWIDDRCLTVMEHPSTQGGNNQSSRHPLMIKNYNIGTPAIGMQLQVVQVSIALGDIKMNRTKASKNISRGLSSISETQARIPAQTAGYDNSSTASTISLSNTVPGYISLGGQFQFILPSAAETDYAIFGYFSSPSTANTISHNLYITDIRLDIYSAGVTSAAAPALLQWAVAVGSTSESLATTDSATAGTRGTRRLSLGVQSLAASSVVGSMADRSIDANFKSPLLVEPGTYLHLIVKVPVSTPTAGHLIKGVVQMNGFFE